MSLLYNSRKVKEVGDYYVVCVKCIYHHFSILIFLPIWEDKKSWPRKENFLPYFPLPIFHPPCFHPNQTHPKSSITLVFISTTIIMSHYFKQNLSSSLNAFNTLHILCTYYHSFFFVKMGNCIKTTKFSDRVQPPLARWSIYIFASWNTWLILIRWNCSRRYLQSLSNEEYELLEGFVDRTKSTITFASLKAQNSVDYTKLGSHLLKPKILQWYWLLHQCVSYSPWSTCPNDHGLGLPHLPSLDSQLSQGLMFPIHAGQLFIFYL